MINFYLKCLLVILNYLTASLVWMFQTLRANFGWKKNLHSSSIVLDLLSSTDNPFLCLGNLGFDFFIKQLSITIPAYSENNIICTKTLYSVLHRWPGAEHIYTDASKSFSGTGCIFYVPSTRKHAEFKLTAFQLSIFTAEAIAIYEALLFVRDVSISQTQVISDTLSVLTALDNLVFITKVSFT